ncbi:alpha/beta hydrolase [Phanerochaete sordida]|uniref:Carboxypeptidase n=1 Tax=Phanerochaete sordida TaxID=48140 RepID=A0A9P3LF06_9APHY|nr:alpha/beta hydrolase [Phanerochaete sordida]
MFPRLWPVAFATLLLPILGLHGRMMSKADIQAEQAIFNAQRFATLAASSGHTRSTGVQSISFSNPKAAEFYVDGTAIPEVDFDLGPSWAGLMPISGALYFWFFPPGPEGSLDDLIFWTNGGPGCSSLEGLLQENGPFSWSPGQAKATQNQYSWTNLSSVLWVEQPVGTGFSQGIPNIRDENDLAEQFVGFMQQFLEVFSELKGKNFYLTGESYAGMYVPHITHYIYEHPTALDLKTKGFWISDPSIGYDVIQQEMPAVNFVKQYQNVFALNGTFMAHIESIADSCGYTDYSKKFVTYPPKGPLPVPRTNNEGAAGCKVWKQIFKAAVLTNPAFNIYRIFDTWPVLWDVLGFPGSFSQAQTLPLYFDRADVKQAIHAPVHVTWSECANIHVFPTGDNSAPSFTILPNIIEKSERAVIVHGLADYVLMAEGTRAVIQNITWHGLQGFQTPIKEDTFIVDGMGALGRMHSERGLTYYEVALSGHMVPQFSPKAAFQIMEYLMGFRDAP